MSKTIICTPSTWTFFVPTNNKIICHHIENRNVSKDSKFAVNPCNTNCTCVCFKFCTFYEFPSAASIFSHCPLITLLVIHNSKLSRITAEDLKGFENLKRLHINFCDIEHLPGDLFKHSKNLEIISFTSNKIKTAGDGLINNLGSLKYFDIRLNSGIDYYFNSFTKTGTLVGLKAKLKDLKNNSELWKSLEAKDNEIAALKTRCNKLENQLKLKVSTNQLNTMKGEMKILADDSKESKEKIETLMMQVQQSAANFVVKVNEKEFKVNKQLLKNHSKALETLIDANPETDCLELKDVSVAVFDEVLKFMKTGNPPNENVDHIELFGAACRLEIEALIQIVAQLLQEKVNPETSLKVLILCNKYKDHVQLKAKAFDEFKKNFPHFTINPEFALNPEKLKQLLKAKQEMDKALFNN